MVEVLQELEVGDGDAAGVGQQVRQHEDLALAQDLVRRGGGGPVRALAHDLNTRVVTALAGLLHGLIDYIQHTTTNHR